MLICEVANPSINDLKRYIKDLEPTAKFIRIHGNYCGPGNRGGEPVDYLDYLCQLHDVCYKVYGKNNAQCDFDFLNWVNRMDPKTLTKKQRLARYAIIKWFQNVLRRHDEI